MDDVMFAPARGCVAARAEGPDAGVQYTTHIHHNIDISHFRR